MGTTKNVLFFWFVQDTTMDLFNIDLSGDTVAIGSLVNGDGQVSVTRSYAFFSS